MNVLKSVSWWTVSCMILVSTLRKYLHLHETFSSEIEYAIFLLFSAFSKHKNFPLHISLYLPCTGTRKQDIFKISACEPWSADYWERFWFLLIKVGQGRRSWQKFLFTFQKPLPPKNAIARGRESFKNLKFKI